MGLASDLGDCWVGPGKISVPLNQPSSLGMRSSSCCKATEADNWGGVRGRVLD